MAEGAPPLDTPPPYEAHYDKVQQESMQFAMATASHNMTMSVIEGMKSAANKMG